MGSLETVTATKLPDVRHGIALIGEKQVVESTGCNSQREGDTFVFSMEHGGEPMLVRQAIRDAIEETGCFKVVERPVRSKRDVPAEGTGEG